MKKLPKGKKSSKKKKVVKSGFGVPARMGKNNCTGKGKMMNPSVLTNI